MAIASVPTRDELLSAAQVALIAKAHQSTIWRWAKSGVLPAPVRVGGSTRWRKSEVLRALKLEGER